MKLAAWLSSSLVRAFPQGGPRGRRQRYLSIPAARGERVSFQACLWHNANGPLDVCASARAPEGTAILIRRVGCVPLPHFNTNVPPDEIDGYGILPGYVPDPLYPENSMALYPHEVGAFWFTVEVERTARPGRRSIPVELRIGDKTVSLETTLEISEVVLEQRRNFTVLHWFYPDALCDWYKVEPYGKAFWPICEKYMRNYAEHGNDGIYVPAFTQPTDGVKRPTQLLIVRRDGDRYRFDWRHVRSWIALVRRCGIFKFEWVHLFTQWGARHAIRIYKDRNDDNCLLWPPDTDATSPTYRDFLAQYLPELHRFLVKEDLLDASFFHLSDEPHGDEHLENYRRARQMLRELAPWMKVMDALSDIRFAQQGLTDIPIPSIQTAVQFHQAGIPSWCYFCSGPRGRYLNRLLDTPLPKLRMAGYLFYRFQFHGFLHWGYNYWYKSQTRQLIDPFTVTDGLAAPGWAHGDTFVVYPGPDGPLDSIRWEVWAESLQDYALLQTLGIDPESSLMAQLRAFDDFPKSERWLLNARRRLLGRRTAQ